jgi:hypothetical protein
MPLCRANIARSKIAEGENETESDMPAFPRDELEEMMRRWVAANDDAGATGDWSKMPEFFTEDAVVRTLIDDQKGEIIGIWRQVAPVEDPDGQPYEIRGTGGSWFRYAGDFKWEWQRDFFDHGNAGAVFGAMAKNGQLTPRMVERMKKGSKMPGWTRRGGYDWMAGILNIEA